MENKELLKKLQDQARELASLSKWLKGNGQSHLSELVTVQHRLNFKVQDIVQRTPTAELENALEILHLSLYSQMEYFRDNRIDSLMEYYAAAIDGLMQIKNIIWLCRGSEKV